MTQDNGFTLDQAITAQKALRSELGLGEGSFPVEAFVGMISDEIDQHREAGRSDEQIAEIIHKPPAGPQAPMRSGAFTQLPRNATPTASRRTSQPCDP